MGKMRALKAGTATFRIHLNQSHSDVTILISDAKMIQVESLKIENGGYPVPRVQVTFENETVHEIWNGYEMKAADPTMIRVENGSLYALKLGTDSILIRFGGVFDNVIRVQKQILQQKRPIFRFYHI